MIDAYEIGIQLALQDGVSAGLQVIARELGALDRAVAATAGRLEGLTRTATEARRAVAAVGSGRTPAVAGPEAVGTATPDAGPAAVPIAGTPRVRAGDPPVALPVRGTASFEPPAAMPGVRVAASAGPVAPAGAIRVTPAVVTALPAGPAGPSVTAAVPLLARPLPVVTGEARATPVSAGPVPPTRSAAAAGLPVSAVINPPPPRTPPVGSEQVATPATPVMSGRQPAVQVRGSMPELVAAREPVTPRPTAAAQPRRAAGRVDVTPPMIPPVTRGIEVAARAPVSPGGSGRGPASGAAGGNERRGTPSGELGDRPAAPVGQSQEGGRGGGDVMLDGRLVGHWLADRMGRDAGRPSAGTTAFDARQAPAWAPSGSF